MCLWDGHLPSLYHTQGVTLRIAAKSELIPSSWKFSWQKAYSYVNRLCALCSGFREGSRKRQGAWPQTWGIPLFCLEQCEAGSPQLPLHSKCPTPGPNLDARDTSQFLAQECWFPLPHSIPKWPRQHSFHFYMSLKKLHTCCVWVFLQCSLS